jgi:hypothetical protein
VHFEVVHEFDISLDAIELAVLSPELLPKLVAHLKGMETIQQKTHTMMGNVLERVWSFQANLRLPSSSGFVTREMLAWDERSLYSMKTHASEWTIVPKVKPEWRKHFSAAGTYRLLENGEGRTRRLVQGHIELSIPIVKPLAERVIIMELKKTYEAEAAILRDLATLE